MKIYENLCIIILFSLPEGLGIEWEDDGRLNE